MDAYNNLAISYWSQWLSQQSPAAQTLEPALAAAQRALPLNDSYHWNHIVLGYISLYQQRYEQALAEMERGVALDPTEAGTYVTARQLITGFRKMSGDGFRNSNPRETCCV